MTGQELIDYIKENHLEECEIGFEREPGSEPDRCFGSIYAEAQQLNNEIVYVF